MLHHVSFVAPPATLARQPNLDGVRPLHDTELLDMIDPAPGARVILIGSDAIGLLCELLRRGCLSAAAVRLADRPETGMSDIALVVAPIASAGCADAAVAQARRALAPSGRIAMRLAADPSGTLAQAAHRALLLHGFSAIRLRESMGWTLLEATLAAQDRRSGTWGAWPWQAPFAGHSGHADRCRPSH